MPAAVRRAERQHKGNIQVVYVYFIFIFYYILLEHLPGIIQCVQIILNEEEQVNPLHSV